MEWMARAAEVLYREQSAEFGDAARLAPEELVELPGAREAYETGQDPESFVVDFVTM